MVSGCRSVPLVGGRPLGWAADRGAVALGVGDPATRAGAPDGDLQHDAEGSIDWWFDVVNRTSFPEYMGKITEYYNEWLVKGGVDPWPPVTPSGIQPKDP